MGATVDYGVPEKRSVTIAGHQTSISLEPVFWRALESAALEKGLPVNALVAKIDAQRLETHRPPNLTSALRQWLFVRGVSELGVFAPAPQSGQALAP